MHRDLKPANIKLTADGKVKVLDFGLAKAFDNDTRILDPANSPTLTISPTSAGVILGTAGYMNPEQERGMPVDKRADIWAYGVVLYEMLTGREMFSGETVSDTLAAYGRRVLPKLDNFVDRSRQRNLHIAFGSSRVDDPDAIAPAPRCSRALTSPSLDRTCCAAPAQPKRPAKNSRVDAA